MPINMTCPSCGKLLSAPESAVGKRARCPECGQIMVVPEPVLQAEPIGDPAAPPDRGSASDESLGNGFDGYGAEQQAGPATTGAGEQRRPCPECGELIAAAAAKCRFCGAIFDPRLRGAAHRALNFGRGSPTERVQRIRAPFRTFWSSLALAVVLFIGAIAVGAAQQTPELAIVGVLTALLAALVGAIAYWVLLYRLWAIVQDGRAQTTPGCAVGFLFIPCFNFYWQFVAYWGLCKELNRIRRDYRFTAPEANEALALAACILHCGAGIPYLNTLFLIPWFIVSIIALKRMCDTAAAIVGTSFDPGPPPAADPQFVGFSNAY